jgi:hypothetical protein
MAMITELECKCGYTTNSIAYMVMHCEKFGHSTDLKGKDA